MYGEVEVQLHTFSTLAQDGCECSASCPDFFTSQGKIPQYAFYRVLGRLHSQSRCGGEEKKYD
jgi:hypothetical protein